MADQKNWGVSKAIKAYVDSLPHNAQVSANDELLKAVRKDLPSVTKASLVSALSYMKGEGVLAGGPLKGIYVKPNGKAPSTADMETVVIDNLLDAMAAAEPVLKRCKKLLVALEAIK